MSYTVEVAQFEGPLDLLLDLIEDQKLDITRLSLAEITDQYMDYVRAQEQISLENLADFLSVAAKLILIKSKALLPLLTFDDDEEADIEELERQLAALRTIKDIVPALQHTLQSAMPHFSRKGMWGVQAQFTPPEGLTPHDLEQSFARALGALPQLDKLEKKIVADVISLEKRIVHVQTMVAERAHVAFSEVIRESSTPEDVVVSFLALLELVKQKLIDVRQDGTFSDIILNKHHA